MRNGSRDQDSCRECPGAGRHTARQRPARCAAAWLLAALLTGLPQVTGAGVATRTTLPDEVDRVVVQRRLPPAALSAFVQQVGAAVPLLEINGDAARNPASVMKLVTTFAALEALGPTYQWKTEAYLDGALAKGRLTGDLLLKGYGDPMLVTERLWLLQSELRKRGLRDIDGDLVIDNSWFAREELDPGAFDGQPYRAYNALPDALLVNFQAVNFLFRPDPVRGRVEILTEPALGSLEIRNQMRIIDGGCNSPKNGISMVVSRPDAPPRITFSGALARNCPEYQLLRSVLDGPTYSYSTFRGMWEAYGGSISGELRQGQVPAGKKPFLTFNSPPLAEVIRPVNKFSNNVMTRQIFLTLGAELLGPPGTLDKGQQATVAALARRGLNFPELVMGNGAGLARQSRITTSHLGQLLLAAQAAEYQPEFQASMSLSGFDGTTRRRFQKDPLAGKMHLKTGTLNGVSAIAGYARGQSGAVYAVAIVVNEPKATHGGWQEVQNALLRWVSRQ